MAKASTAKNAQEVIRGCLRRRMIEAMTTRDRSPETQRRYLRVEVSARILIPHLEGCNAVRHQRSRNARAICSWRGLSKYWELAQRERCTDRRRDTPTNRQLIDGLQSSSENVQYAIGIVLSGAGSHGKCKAYIHTG